MKALMKVAKGPEGVMIQDIPEPQPKPGEIKVRVHACGICGTDIHIMHDEFFYKAPVVMGHECSGVVAEVGSEVTEFKPGDRVVVDPRVVFCGKCRYCREGLVMLCNDGLSVGVGVNGAFAQYLTVPAQSAFKIPDNVSLDEAALGEPFACSVRGVIERGRVSAGEHVLVSGPGTIGLCTMQVALASGGKVTVAGTSVDRDRLKLASELGAAATIIVDEEDAAARADEITGGAGFDVAFECAGAAASADMCLRLLRKNSLYTQIGLYGKKIEFDLDLALYKEIQITNNFARERTSWEIALRLLGERQVNLLPLISAKLPLADWEKAFGMMVNKQGLKILLDPSVI
jgi:L-iditol 2-dehydrogenase